MSEFVCLASLVAVAALFSVQGAGNSSEKSLTFAACAIHNRGGGTSGTEDGILVQPGDTYNYCRAIWKHDDLPPWRDWSPSRNNGPNTPPQEGKPPKDQKPTK